MRKLILLLCLFPALAFGATINKPVTELIWNNPSTNTDVTSILITCGSLTYSATASTAITAGQQGSRAVFRYRPCSRRTEPIRAPLRPWMRTAAAPPMSIRYRSRQPAEFLP